MKRKLCCLILMLLACRFCNGQVLCIYCYDQNDSISNNVNNLLLNGGFENNNCIPGWQTGSFCPNSNYYDCNITNWTCTGGGIYSYPNMQDNSFSPIVEGIVAPYFGNGVGNVCSPVVYDTTCLNNTFCTVSGVPIGYPISHPNTGGAAGVSLEQTVNGLVQGNTYVLEFWAGGEVGPPFSQSGLFAVDVGFGDTLMRDKPTSPFGGIGTRFIIEFNATSSSHTIKFTNWGHICDSCTELVLDDVRLYTLAELDASVPHCMVGIDNPNFQNEENIFPNPITNELNVKTNTTALSEIIIYDITSRKLFNQSFINSTSINTEQLAKGIYLYEVRNKNGVIKKGKVMKD